MTSTEQAFGLRFTDHLGHHTVLMRYERWPDEPDGMRVKLRREGREWWCRPPRGVVWQVYPAIDGWTHAGELVAKMLADRLNSLK